MTLPLATATFRDLPTLTDNAQLRKEGELPSFRSCAFVSCSAIHLFLPRTESRVNM